MEIEVGGSKPLLRRGPRCTFWIDFNLQWLWPAFEFSGGLGYLHFGWLSVGFGFGKARDIMWDTFERGAQVHART